MQEFHHQLQGVWGAFLASAKLPELLSMTSMDLGVAQEFATVDPG